MSRVSGTLPFGPVVILDGPHKGRVGNYDDDDSDSPKAIIHFGSILESLDYHLIPKAYLRVANTHDLVERSGHIGQVLSGRSKFSLTTKKRCDLLQERSWIDRRLNDDVMELWFGRNPALKGARTFLSHSSKDKGWVNRVATDLAKMGVVPWLDSWRIRAGDSIPEKVGIGIKDSDCVIVFLSKNAIASRWVEREWQAKFWDEIQRNQVLVIPVLLEDCEIPTLLQAKKYADFRKDYNEGMQELLLTLSQLESGKRLGKPKKISRSTR